ncbi:hypothetical protein H0194_02605 [Corynebacterium incognita]|uniref:Wadjet protein JetD C-terminal domain-containing protein n=1 Tax=Corynebacterium incognita TaxID=2754725 RepID=A0A7G7CQS7_9CORY|nr:DUF3322 domain-containing protein [Corynebacterium incognita]QNE89943.1 hypothetical protein H0194_02605 [Corynebacterium incognita]
MRTPSDLRAHAQSLLRKNYATALATPDELNLNWPLHPPTAQAAGKDTAATKRFITDWKRWPQAVEVTFETRRWTHQGLGTNAVPVRVTLNGAQRIAAVAGLGTEFSRLRTTAATIIDAFPDNADFATSVYKLHRQWANLHDADVTQLIACLHWLHENPNSGMWERAVPVLNVDGKWIGNHRKLLKELLAPLGVDGLGLRTTDPRLRVRFLNGSHQFPDLEVPFADAARLVPAGQRPTVLIVENKQTFLALPNYPTDTTSPIIAVFGSGYAAQHLHELPWLHNAHVGYWGDLDADGFAILNSLRSHLPNADLSSLLMDAATVKEFTHLAVSDPQSRSPLGLNHLTDDERRAANLLFTEGGLRIEQERIPFTHAEAIITDWLDAALG